MSKLFYFKSLSPDALWIDFDDIAGCAARFYTKTPERQSFHKIMIATKGGRILEFDLDTSEWDRFYTEINKCSVEDLGGVDA